MASLPEAENWITSRHYHEVPPQDSTPLLHNPHRRGDFLGGKLTLMCLLILLITGVATGIYLLCIEDEPIIPEKFFFVPRARWSSKMAIPPEISTLSLPTERVLFLPTNTSECWNNSECLTELRKLQKEQTDVFKEPDILYNFIVAGDGRIYEGRGWDYESSYLDDGRALLAIAFLGRYDDVPPSQEQNRQLTAFLDYAVMENNLTPCFKILVRDIHRHIADVAFAIEKKVRDDYRCRR